MKSSDIAWVVIFVILLLTMNLIGYGMKMYIKDKPPGTNIAKLILPMHKCQKITARF